MTRQRGQAAPEYLGMLLIVAVIVGAVAFSSPGTAIAQGVEAALCRIAGQDGGAAQAPAQPSITRPARDLAALLDRGGSPEQVAAYFAELDPAVQERLARERPQLVGNTNGAPISLRFIANRVVLSDAIARLEEAGEDGDRLAKLRELRDGNGQFLLFDPSGDGRIAQVYGDLTTARHVAVVVPGMNNELDNFSGANAQRLQQQADDFDPGRVATIQWLGYDTPEGATALGGRAADPGARDLPGFVEGISAARGQRLHTTVIAHSYGSLVTGKAMRGHGLEVDEVAFIGSPGVGTLNRDDLGHVGTTQVWAAVARNDVVGASGWHGTPPTSPLFGAREFHTGDVSGHSSYFQEGSESLRNLGLIVSGHIDEVNTTR